MVKKTMHELTKEFPDKSYRELEKYRDADRQQEAQRIITQQENEELKEEQHKETKDSPEVIKLKKEICELRQDNRKLAHEVEDRVDKARKSGM